ncbi:hypothetical protein BUALT_Bualt05G0159000 [Buddleja alternifolia]|uniref:2-phytyl-1,4-beta-naphthoquinone methyltransferase, chloroplastic n=1 Tax=Buddleja alternifolia TaxID=168488 RepID=A0AAV6XSY0_9LAMI|nr:hypothetical protein BUALT_Bualt05G0159000 [Buddleja alternifolia]
MAALQFTPPPIAGGRCRSTRRPVQCASERQALFNRVAPVYDNLNDLLSLGRHRVWKRMAVSWSGAKEGDTVLDVCCGSGDLAFLLSEKVGINGKVIALDFSTEQLQIAASRQHERTKACFKNIEWIEGDAVDLPFSDSSFDSATIGYGLRNVVDRKKALEQMFRVLKPGSKLSVLDFNKSTSLLTSSIQDWMIDSVVVPVASGYGLASEYQYLKNSIKEYLIGKELENLALEAGFSEAKFFEIEAGFMGNLLNDLFSLGSHRVWKRMAVSWSGAKEGDTVLDVCCGSGDLTFLLSEKVGINGKVIALDYLKEQLQIAQSRQLEQPKSCYKNIEWIEGDAIELPFSDSSFDAATMGFGLRHIVDRKKALEEMLRVLKPGSKVSFLDFNKSTSPLTSTIQDWLIDYVFVPVASGYGLASEYRFLKTTVKEYLTGNELEKLALEAGFFEAKFFEIGHGFMGNLVATR